MISAELQSNWTLFSAPLCNVVAQSSILIGSLLYQLANPYEFIGDVLPPSASFHVDLVSMGVEKGEEVLWGGGVGILH